MSALTKDQRASWEANGFIRIDGFASRQTCDAMLERVIEIARQSGGAGLQGGALVMPEQKPNPNAQHPEDRVSKVFKLHRDSVFHEFAKAPELVDRVEELLVPELDCFLSQFIFKSPGAMGQPWHQDAHYFPFDRPPQVGAWLAVSEATLENGPLYVLPGSHRKGLCEHVPDPRPGSNFGYMEVQSEDTSAQVPLLMEPGDLLLFHSDLMHRSTDNVSQVRRAAMVYHFADAGTAQRGPENFVNDWMPVRRAATASTRS